VHLQPQKSYRELADHRTSTVESQLSRHLRIQGCPDKWNVRISESLRKINMEY